MKAPLIQSRGGSVIVIAALLVMMLSPPAPAQPTEQQAMPLRLDQTIQLPQITGGMNHFASDAKRERFFLTGISDEQLLVIDVRAGKVISAIKGFAPVAARFAPDVDRLCVSGAKGVTIYNGDSYAVIGKVDLGVSVDELQYDPRNQRLYAGITDSTNPAIAIIDVPNQKLLAKVKLPSAAQGFVLEENGTRLFVNTPGAKQVTVIDAEKQSVVAEWELNGAEYNYPAALDEKNRRLFIGCRKPAQLSVIDTESGKIVATAETGTGADDMSFDPGTRRIYLACGGNGVISVVQQKDADHYSTIANVPTAPKARNSLFVPELKRFYLAVPRQQDKPTELRGYKAID